MKTINTIKRVFFILLFEFVIFNSSNINAQCTTGGSQNGGYGNGGDNTNPHSTNERTWFILGVAPRDPNDLIGTNGYIEKKWVSVNDKLKYTVHFENDPKIATAPAQNVFIHMVLNDKVNINSLQLTEFGFGRYSFQLRDNPAYFSTRLDLRDSLNIYVDVIAGIDIVKNEIFWSFKSIDPATGSAPIDPTKGFLPVNDTTKENDTIPGPGQGFVSFQISPNKNDITGDTTFAQAIIKFDIEQDMSTNSWSNTIDALAPVSKINSSLVSKDTITLFWNGKDDDGGTGVRDYALYASENGGTFLLNQAKITNSSATFVGTPGSTYRFFTLATDNVGNQETLKKAGDVIVKLDSIVILPVTWLYFKGQQNENDALLSWATTNEVNCKLFVVERSFDGRQFSDIGKVNAVGNTNQTSNYYYTDKDAMLSKAQILYYRLRKIDNDGQFSYSIVVSIPIKQISLEPIVKAYPNPFRESITLQIISVTSTDQADFVEIYSTAGKLIYRKKLLQQGSSTILLNDLPEISAGMYILRTSVNNKMYTIKMVHSK